MSRQDELLALANAQAAQQALSSIESDTKDAQQSYQDAVEMGDTAAASVELRRMADLAAQGQIIANAAGAGAPQQQQQSQYTQAELQWLANHTAIANDPRKMA